MHESNGSNLFTICESSENAAVWKPANLLRFGTRVYVCNFSSSSEDDMVVIRPYVYYLVRRTDFLAAPALES